MSAPTDWGFIADDLTGAALVGGKLANVGLKAVVATSVDHAADLVTSPSYRSAVIGICTDTRNLDPRSARERAEAAVSALAASGRRRVFKFVDSTLRGQVGVELAAIHRALGARDCLVMPGTPSAGRTVSGGVVLVEGRPASHSPLLDNEVLARLPSSDVVQLFSVPGVAAAKSVAMEEWARDEFWTRLDRAVLASGMLSFEVLDAPDAASFVHVQRFLETTPRTRALDLICGSVGLAEVWVELLQREIAPEGASQGDSQPDQLTTPPFDDASPVLVVNGSASPAALAQVDHLRRRGMRVACWPQRADDDKAATELLAAELAGALLSDNSAALTVPPPTSGGPGLDPDSARCLPGQIARVVGRLFTSESGPARCRLVLVGGMTAAAILERLGVRNLAPVREVGFVTLCQVEPPMDRLGVVALKGGAAGDEAALDMIVRDARAR